MIPKSWRVPLGILFIILLGAFLLRIYKLDLIPVFVDEAIYIRWAQVMRAESTLRFLPLSDGKQPLFMWAVMPALKFISDPLVAGRMVSVATGLGTTVGVFVLSYVLFNSKKISLMAALLYALSPFAFFFDRMALVDSMLSFFGIWTLTFAILTVKYLRLDLAFITGFFLGGALLTKSPALFFVILLPTAFMFVDFKSKKTRVRNIVWTFGLLLVSFGLSFAIYNILRLGPNFHLIGSRNFDYVYPYRHILESPFDPLRPHLDRALEWLESIGPGAILVMIAAGVITNFRKHKKEILLLLVWGVLPIIIQSEFSRVFTSRYIFFTLPPLFILAASFASIKKKPLVYMVYLTSLVFVIQAVVFYIPFFRDPSSSSFPERDGYLADWTGGAGIKEAAQIIRLKRDANPGKSIVVGTEGYFGTLPDGLQIYLEKETNITIIGVGLDLLAVPESLADSASAGNITYLLVNGSRLGLNPPFEKFKLSTVASYEKPQAQNGSRDRLYLFEVNK